MNKFNLLKYLSKWKYLIFAVCVLGALIVYKYAMYNQEYTASYQLYRTECRRRKNSER